MILGIGAGIGFGQTAQNSPAEQWAMAMNGTSDYIQLPTMTYTAIEIDAKYVTQYGYYVDSRVGATAYMQRAFSNTSDTFVGFTVYKNGVQQTSGTNIVNNTDRMLLKLQLATPSADDVTIFAKNTGGTELMKGTIYSIKMYNGANLIAHYDFTQKFDGTTIPDKSGNGRTATLTGGTWVQQ